MSRQRIIAKCGSPSLRCAFSLIARAAEGVCYMKRRRPAMHTLHIILPICDAIIIRKHNGIWKPSLQHQKFIKWICFRLNVDAKFERRRRWNESMNNFSAILQCILIESEWITGRLEQCPSKWKVSVFSVIGRICISGITRRVRCVD